MKQIKLDLLRKARYAASSAWFGLLRKLRLLFFLGREFDKRSSAANKENDIMPAVAPVERTCIVCGMASHRSDWINKLEKFVACDFHKKDEVASAVAKTKATPAAAAPVTVPKTDEGKATS